MPTYEYECKACGHELEVFQSMSAPARRKCPACAKPKLSRKIGLGGGILFKGSGFYQTDYRSKSYRDAASRSEETPKPEGTAKKTESKDSPSSAPPAAKPEKPD